MHRNKFLLVSNIFIIKKLYVSDSFRNIVITGYNIFFSMDLYIVYYCYSYIYALLSQTNPLFITPSKVLLSQTLTKPQKLLDTISHFPTFASDYLKIAHHFSHQEVINYYGDIMSGEFLGTFSNSVNKQKWITIPSSFKKKFSPGSKQSVIVTIGPKSVIAIFPLDNWTEFISKLRSDKERGPALLRNLRDFASPEQKMEQNGRIKVDQELLKIAGVDDKVIIKGEGNYISVWNPDKFKEQREQRIKEHFDTYDSIDYQI